MSDLTNNPPSGGNDDKPIVQSYSHQPIVVRVPEKVGAACIAQGSSCSTAPRNSWSIFCKASPGHTRWSARVVLSPQTMQEFINAVQSNLENYSKTFGAPPPLPPPPTQNRPTIEEIYQNYKLPEDMMSGAYANSVLIGHGVTEFFFDFISGFYPNSAVASRVFMAAPQIPRFITMLNTAMQNYTTRYQKKPPEPPTQP